MDRSPQRVLQGVCYLDRDRVWGHVLNCRKGYLDIVRWLCESGGATSEIDGAPGVDVRSKGGWTPLSECMCISGSSVCSLVPCICQ